MQQVIDKLRSEADFTTRMIGVTAPTQWLANFTQEEWEKKEKEKAEMLYKAAKILEATL